jgi:hypothetical protein
MPRSFQLGRGLPPVSEVRIPPENLERRPVLFGRMRAPFSCFRTALAFMSMMWVACGAGAASWAASADYHSGLPLISRHGTSVLGGNFVVWDQAKALPPQEWQLRVVGPFDYLLTGKYGTPDLVVSGRISRDSNHRMVWQLDLSSGRAQPNVDAGIEFKFDLKGLGAGFGSPELLPGNRGWTWGRVGGTRAEVIFEPPLAAISFGEGGKSEVRALIFQGGIPKGGRRQIITMTIAGEAAITPSVAERFGTMERAAWRNDMLDWSSSPVDLSFLNKGEIPAGKRGFLTVNRDQLVFADGTPARFWGTNLTSYALFTTSPENVRIQARRLSQLGFNLVRLHHHDSLWVEPNIFGEPGILDTQTLSSSMLEQLDWWLSCLKDEGIYVWLDLHVGRRFKPGDRIPGFDEIRKGGQTADPKGYSYVNTGIRSALQRFNEDFLNHLNKHTGKRYKEEPAIAAMLITNENDLTGHYGNALLPDRKVPQHHALYAEQARAFAAKHGLPAKKVWRSWEHGPSKLFLNDLEQRFDAEMILHLRQLGVKVPLVTTSTWGLNPLSSLPALTSGNVIDGHSYGGMGELEKNPVFAPNMMHWLAAAQVAGRPLSVSEWNVEPFPVPDRHAMPLYMAASARLQGWDAVMQYAYTQAAPNGPGYPSNWHAYNDPALIATLPAAALLYRRGDVQESRTVYAFAPTAEQLFGQPISPANAAALRTAAEKGRLVIALPQVIELPWLEKSEMPAGARVIIDPQQLLIDRAATEVVSDTGELRRNWEQGIYTIDTPRTQAATGWIGGRRIELADVGFEAITRNASICVQSLDGRPIHDSGTILVSLGARAEPETVRRLPFRAEPVLGRIDIRAPRGLKLYAAKAGPPNRRLHAPYLGGRYRLKLEQDPGTYWLVLKK